MNTYHDDLSTGRISAHTCGMLQQAPTPFPHTIRPPSLPVQVTVSLPMPQVPTRKVMHGTVIALVSKARANDVKSGDDLPYMQLERMTLTEAILHLRRKGYLLIQDGCLYFGLASGGLHVRMWGRKGFPTINPHEAKKLLLANYPLSKGATRRHPADLIHDRPTMYVPVVRVQPVPMAGVGFFCTMPYGTDIDLIPESAWQVIAFPQGLSHQLLFIGDISLDGLSHYVWWSVPVAAYICQEIPHLGDHHATE